MIQIIDSLAKKLAGGIGLSFGELKEYRNRKKKEIADYKAAHKKKEFPILHTVEESMPHNDRKRYLKYCLSLIRAEYPQHHDLLILIMNGWTHKRISKEMQRQGYNYSEDFVSKMEAEAVQIMKEKITELRNHGTPIFSDLPAQELGLRSPLGFCPN